MDKLESLVARLEAVAVKFEGGAPAAGGAPGAGGAAAAAGGGDGGASAAFVAAFDDFVSGSVAPAVAAGKALGDNKLTEQMVAVEAVFKAQRAFLVVASKSKKPAMSDFPALLKPMQDELAKIDKCVARSDYFNHLKAVCDGMACTGWVGVEPAPAPFVQEMEGSFLFYGNKVLREFKDKDPKHVEFVNKFTGLIKDLQAYVKEHHRTGVTWNSKGGDAKAAAATAGGGAAGGAAPPPPMGGPPPPGPPPPPGAFPSAPAAASKAAPDTGALFAQINAGNVTKGLRKVTDEMKTHKNPSLRAGNVVPASKSEGAPAAARPAASAPKVQKPPKIELDGKKWWVENHSGNKEIVLEDVNNKQSIFIANCHDCVIQIKGKVNQITIEKSSKTGVVFESVVAAVDLVNSQRLQVQCTGNVPSIAIDKVAEAQIYLSQESLGAVITTSLSSDVNVFLPGKEDMVEQSIPYQFQTRIVDGNLVTEAMRHE